MSILKGETIDMLGYAFEGYSKQRKRGQFEDTMGALKTYASTKCVSHIDYLTPIFTDLSQPVLKTLTLANKRIESNPEG